MQRLPRQMTTKSALSYFGSDSRVAPQLASLLDHCKHVTIPFCGGLSILPHLKARAIVANDLHELAINFYRMLSSGHRPALIEMCQKTLSHPFETRLAQSIIRDGLGSDKLVQAWAFWAVCWLGRKGKGGTKHQGGSPSVRRTPAGGTNASRIRAAANDLEAWAKQFERCEWESVCFRELLPKVADREDCGIYVDAPWVGAGDRYLHPFTRQDHEDLAAELSRFLETTVLIRYGDAPLIRELYSDWHIIDAESRDQCNKMKSELWILNLMPEFLGEEVK